MYTYKYIVKEMIKDGEHIGNSFLGKKIYSHFDIRMNDELKFNAKRKPNIWSQHKIFCGRGYKKLAMENYSL
jgi:hypothetical protein